MEADADKTIHALIGASSPDHAKTVAASSAEVSFLKGTDELEGSDDPVGSDGARGDPVVVLRLAQNKGIVEAELAKFQSLVSCRRYICNSQMFGPSRMVRPLLSD